MRLFTFLFIGMLFISSNALAQEVVNAGEKDASWVSGLWNKFTGNISETWKNPTNYNVIVPFYAWHNRLTYDDDKLEKYNEEAFGGGLAMSRYDADGDWHALYGMIFKDSNFYQETMFGYIYQKRWYFDEDKQYFAGAGFTAGFTQRHEYSYIPVPIALPLVGFGHRKFNVNMAYVPGVKNDGNVAFLWAQIEF